MKNYRCFDGRKNASGADVAHAQDIKDDSEVASDIPASDIDNGLSCSSHNCYYRE